MLALVGGELTYFEFEVIKRIDKVEGYRDIVLFATYDMLGRKHLATVNKDSKQPLRLFVLNYKLEFCLLTCLDLNRPITSLNCVHFIQFQNTFVLTYEDG